MSSMLAGAEDSKEFDARACRRYLGTSAGSIVATSLVAGLEPGARLGQLDRPSLAVETADGGGSPLRQILDAATLLADVAAPISSLVLASTASGGALVRRTMIRAIPAGRRALAELGRDVDRAGVEWDGRLRIVALERESGRRVVFGAPDAPKLSVAAAVQASCAIPGVFRPVRAHGRTYVDGGVWSPTNMDALDVADGERVLCLNPTGSLHRARASLSGAFGPLSRGIAGAEALALRGRGAIVTTINPDTASVAAMGRNLMDGRRRQAVIDAGFAQGRRLAAARPRR